MLPYVAEFIGTAMLVLIGNAGMANISLEKSSMKGSGALHISIGWGLAVLLPAYIFGKASGGFLNPAVTLAFAAGGQLSWQVVPGYIIAELLGAILGAILVYVLFADHFNVTQNTTIVRSCFCTVPSIRNLPRNFLNELIGTFILVFSVLGIANVVGASATGVNNLYVCGIITVIVMCFGGLSGTAINPARDLGPRIAYILMPLKYKENPDWQYCLFVPILGPFIGGLLAVFLFKIIPW
ncbi:MIP/aquaporin family protein [Pectinatus brassicae]|uniref:Glycerol uptake facilitator protein n=1 Tax=Pectinatus brassicae TaxID=862415 RepID=A0A840UJ33_9FIRM|nr:MIP/aquaporin family protein [Pectinatus brassicae]MBB5336989.1 glycerol uptake facilitator protein [Pectinatus brassicae]